MFIRLYKYSTHLRVDTPPVCLCMCYNKACSSEETDTARYLGGDPYGRSQSDVDGITATLVLMRSSLALMSDRMTVRGGPHGSQPGRQRSRQTETQIYIHIMHMYAYIVYTCRNVFAGIEKHFRGCCLHLVSCYISSIVLIDNYT